MIKINFEGETPIYEQLKNEIIKEIARGCLKDGDSLPSIRQLSSDLEVNLHTVNKTYNILKDQGYLIIDRRKGAMVSLNNNSKEKFESEEKEALEVLIAKSLCKGYKKEEFLKRIEEAYKNFNE